MERGDVDRVSIQAVENGYTVDVSFYEGKGQVEGTWLTAIQYVFTNKSDAFDFAVEKLIND